ncbi:MAG: hypothetical protein LUD47_06805 [Clostridia bacterium]|nr:hypothetical protein [Clostridia bacterium]
MTEKEKIETVQVMAGDPALLDDARLVAVYLNLAKSAMLSRLYPHCEDSRALPDKYSTLQCELAVWYLSQRGAEGESIHIENSISRTYKSDEEILNMLPSYARIL